MRLTLSFLLIFFTFAVVCAAEEWPAPLSPAIAETDGYAPIPDAAVMPDKSLTYRAIFDATQAADKPDQILPALNMAGSELNAFKVAGVPLSQVKFVVVFHNAAMDGILKDDDYKSKFGVSNPNLPVLQKMKAAGVQLFVCGQNLIFEKIAAVKLAPEITVASDALIVLMTYENKGYALLSF